MNNLKNRARVMLTAVGVLAVVGGALAFKARTTDRIFVRGAGTTICNSTVLARTLTNPGTPALSTTFATTVQNAACPVTVSIYQGL